MGKIPILINIFQRGWNHQLVLHGNPLQGECRGTTAPCLTHFQFCSLLFHPTFRETFKRHLKGWAFENPPGQFVDVWAEFLSQENPGVSPLKLHVCKSLQTSMLSYEGVTT